VTASAPEVSGIEAGIQNSVMGMMGSMGGAAAGAGPVQYPEYVAPPLPQCPAGKQQCSRPECGEYNGCWEPSPLDASGWKCKCLSPPPPPAPGSPNWLSDPKNQVQAPPQGEIANSAMLGMYESGKIALNLEKYLKASADKLESQAELGRMIVDDIKKAQPCKLVVAEDGEMDCEVGLDGQIIPPNGEIGEKVGTVDDVPAAEGDAAGAAGQEGEDKKKGLLGLGMFGLKQTKGSQSLAQSGEMEVNPSLVKTRRMTAEEGHALGKRLEAIKGYDKSLSARDQSEIKQLEYSARQYNGDAARPAASLLFSGLLALAVASFV